MRHVSGRLLILKLLVRFEPSESRSPVQHVLTDEGLPHQWHRRFLYSEPAFVGQEVTYTTSFAWVYASEESATQLSH